MDARHGLAAILRDARKSALLQDEAAIVSQALRSEQSEPRRMRPMWYPSSFEARIAAKRLRCSHLRMTDHDRNRCGIVEGTSMVVRQQGAATDIVGLRREY